MKLHDLFEDDLSEAPFGRLKSAAAGAAMGGMALTGYVGHSLSNQPNYSQVQPSPQGQFNDENDIAYNANTEVHHDKLSNLADLTPKQRVEKFQSQFIVFINKSNDDLLQQRSHILRIKNSKNISDQDKKWLDTMMKTYKASDINDLLTRVDIVPRSLALAQAAIESGWATANITQQGNVFYGQKGKGINTVSDDVGGTYSSFNSPLASVKAYMFNLNTNDAYKSFRALRAKQRAEGKLPNGQTLGMTLHDYSSRGAKYEHQIDALIHQHKWFELDKSAT
jgi:uncharacterized FlgJ-related protein